MVAIGGHWRQADGLARRSDQGRRAVAALTGLAIDDFDYIRADMAQTG